MKADVLELRDLGGHLLLCRLERGLSQDRLAHECGLSQAQVSLFEGGRRLPSLDQFLRLARALDVPVQRLLTGRERPGVDLAALATELRGLGAADLRIANARIPGAARRPEEVLALAIAGGRPDPRVLETVPALLSWNVLNPVILRAYGIAIGTRYRLAWLADVALAIERRKGFPGGCRREALERFVKIVPLPPREAPWDDLGRPAELPPTSPIWRRWKIRYGGGLDDFANRAAALAPARDRASQVAAAGRIQARAAVTPRQPGPAFPSEDSTPRESRSPRDARKERTDGRRSDSDVSRRD